MRALIITALACCLAGCDEKTVTGPTGPINQQVTLAPGQVAPVADAGISIRFVAVIEDSRCPGDALCVRAGDAIIRVEVNPPSGGRSQYDLSLTGVAPATHNGLSLALANLDPYPFNSRGPIPMQDYRATVTVSRK